MLDGEAMESRARRRRGRCGRGVVRETAALGGGELGISRRADDGRHHERRRAEGESARAVLGMVDFFARLRDDLDEVETRSRGERKRGRGEK